MKWTTATALFLALSAGGLGVAVVLNREPKSPIEILAEVREDMTRAGFDESGGLDRLQRALDDPRSTSDPKLAAELLRTRADLFRDLGAFDYARTDLETLLATHRRGDRGLELEIARLQSQDQQVVEALQRTRGLLTREPEFSDAWALRGELEDAAANEKLRQAGAAIDRSLAQADAAEAKAIMLELTSRDVEDPARDFLVKQLRDLFVGASGSDLNEALRLVNEPRSGFKRARAAYAQAMTSSMQTETVISLAQSLERAGRLDLAIQLQTAARSIDSFRQDPSAMSAYLDDLLRAKRVQEARQALINWDWRDGGSLEFFRSAGEVLYRAEDYKALGKVGLGLSRLGGDTGRIWASFFNSIHPIANAPNVRKESTRRAAVNKAIARLRSFANDEKYAEPFYGAKDEAWFWIARGFGALGDTQREQYNLRQALNRRPNFSADSWVRLAETLRKTRSEVPWGDVEDALSRALDLAPDRTDALAPLWFDAGEQALGKRGITIKQIENEVARAGGYTPLRTVGPSVMTQLAASHLENGRNYAAIRAAKEARDEFRNLVPPLDIIIDAELREPKLYSPERHIIERIESAGIDLKVEGFMARLPAGRLSGESLVRAILAAPVRFGKAAVARYYLDLGDATRAGDALVGIDDNTAPAQLRLLRAQLLIQGEEWDAALREVSRLKNDERLAGSALLLRLEALVGAGRLRSLDPIVRELKSAFRATSPRLLTSADLLASCGRADLARELVDQVDRTANGRSIPFYRRRVLVDVLSSPTIGTAAAVESIYRAEAYLEDGTPEIGAILLAVGERDWTSLPDLVKRLEDSSFVPSETQAAALSLLGERLESGRRAATAGLEAAPRDPHWAFLRAVADALIDADLELGDWFGPEAAPDAQLFLRGTGERAVQDPRDALALYLVASDPNWTPWVLPRLGELRSATGSVVWSKWIETLAHTANERGDRVGKTVEALLRTSPRFGPAHDLAVRKAKEDNPTEPLHPVLVRARRKRLASMGEDLIQDPIEIALARSGEKARRGDYVGAAQALQPVIQSGGPQETEGRLMLGILTLRAGQPSLAAVHLNQAAMRGAGVFQDVVIDSLLFSIRHAIETSESGTAQRGALTKERALEMLERLTEKYPLDPIVALAQLEFLEVGEGERGARAAGVIERLYKDSGGKTLDQLRQGCTRRWVEFLAPIASDVALDLVDRDLELQPGNLDLWQLGGYVAEIRSETALARKYYETLMQIDPRPRTGYALAELLIEDGAAPGEVNPILTKASRAQGGGSSRALYLRTVAEMRLAQPKLGSIVPRLAGLWNSRERSRREVDSLALGLLYADALFRRGKEEDMVTLNTLLNDLESDAANSLYEGEVVRALRGLRESIVTAGGKRSPRAPAEPKTAKAE